MGACADRFDPHARMGVSNECVRLEAEGMQRVPEPAFDELQERELRRRQDAAPQARLIQHRHEAWRRKMMLIHDLERPGGDFPRREHAIGKAKRLRIEGERLFWPGPAVVLAAWQPSRQESKQPSRFVAALDAL